jgi:hypothetical protein
MSMLKKVKIDKDLVKMFKKEGAEFHKVIKKYNSIRPKYEEFLADFIKRNIVKDDLFLQVLSSETQSLIDYCYDEPNAFISDHDVLENVIERFLSSIDYEDDRFYLEDNYQIKLTTY